MVHRKPGKGGKRRSRKFTGPLATPVRIKFYHSTLADGSPEEAHQRNIQEHQRALREWLSKVDLLFARYGVSIENRDDWEKRDWPALVLRMAIDLIPGFQVVGVDRRGQGRPASPFEDICLLVDVELVKQDLGSDGSAVSDTKAGAALKEQPPFKSRWGRLSARGLRNKLSKARRSENPLAALWRLEGQIGQVARDGLIEMFGATTQNIFVSRSIAAGRSTEPSQR